METVSFNGWEDCARLSDGSVELIVTRAVGPRVIRFGFVDAPNMFAEVPGQQGGANEDVWMIRGGHRFWVAPEANPWSYELDNTPCEIEPVDGGLRTRQAPGPVTGLAKEMEIVLGEDSVVDLTHTLVNRSSRPVRCAGWALSAMGLEGQAIVPLPRKIPHAERLTHNQHWSLWGYSDLSDPRWTIGARCLLFRQDPSRGPNKLGMAHREGWVGYQRKGMLFVKRFGYDPDAEYPDGGCNFDTFSNEEFLELESVGGLTTLAPGECVRHTERWELYDGVPPCRNDAEVERHVRPLTG